jgi:hypothetical protein
MHFTTKLAGSSSPPTISLNTEVSLALRENVWMNCVLRVVWKTEKIRRKICNIKIPNKQLLEIQWKKNSFATPHWTFTCQWGVAKECFFQCISNCLFGILILYTSQDVLVKKPQNFYHFRRVTSMCINILWFIRHTQNVRATVAGLSVTVT